MNVAEIHSGLCRHGRHAVVWAALFLVSCAGASSSPDATSDALIDGADEDVLADIVEDTVGDIIGADAPPESRCEFPLATTGICATTCEHLCECGWVTEDPETCPAPCAIYEIIASEDVAAAFESCVLGIPCDEMTDDSAVGCILAGVAPSEEGAAICEALAGHMQACLFVEGFQQTAGLFCQVHATSHDDLTLLEGCVAAAEAGASPGLFNPPPISEACADLETCLMDVLHLRLHPSWH